MWGSEGKGTISIVIANAAAVSFFSSIFSGSSTSYFASRFRIEKILLYAYLWSLFIGLPFLFSFTSIQSGYLVYLIGISVFSSLLSTNISLFVGTQNIRRFNVYTVLQQLVHIIFIGLLVYGFNQKEVSVYFLAQIGCLALLFITSFFQIIKKCDISEVSFSEVARNMFEYGWKTQLSAFVQFLNYRLSFYFLEYFEGIASVGIFSIGVTFSEDMDDYKKYCRSFIL
jgi:O-antigen/teichoic acid export membrane protein